MVMPIPGVWAIQDAARRRLRLEFRRTISAFRIAILNPEDYENAIQELSRE